MQKLGFWFENHRIATVDLSSPELGNAGVGGTEYQFVLLAYLLLLMKPEDVEVTFFLEAKQSLPKGIKQVVVPDLNAAYKKSSAQSDDFLIFRPRRDITDEIIQISFNKTKLIPWLHITPKRNYLDWFVNNPVIHRVVFVGDDQRLRTIDHKVFANSSTIFNASCGIYKATGTRKNNSVVYLGALVPRKGFHILAKAWSDVRKEIPQAELFVVGSGALYDKNAQLGSLKLAESSYEDQFVNLLGGEDGIQRLGVHFLGNLGLEKKNIIDSATVGVVNPSGLTENCPMSVVEFYQSGVPVVSSVKYGMRDMIVSGETGVLCRSSSDLSAALIKFLNGSLDSERFGSKGIEFAKEKFSPELIVENWMQIFAGEFKATGKPKGYWVHRSLAIIKRLHLLPSNFPMVEDQKIYLARLRDKFLKIRR
jgi:glycosyltransferase involved in cell wall biosynthesis